MRLNELKVINNGTSVTNVAVRFEDRGEAQGINQNSTITGAYPGLSNIPVGSTSTRQRINVSKGGVCHHNVRVVFSLPMVTSTVTDGDASVMAKTKNVDVTLSATISIPRAIRNDTIAFDQVMAGIKAQCTQLGAFFEMTKTDLILTN